MREELCSFDEGISLVLFEFPFNAMHGVPCMDHTEIVNYCALSIGR